MVHMVWRRGNSFRPCYGVAKSVHNFDATYHDVTPIKLDSRPHYELRSANAITCISRDAKFKDVVLETDNLTIDTSRFSPD